MIGLRRYFPVGLLLVAGLGVGAAVTLPRAGGPPQGNLARVSMARAVVSVTVEASAEVEDGQPLVDLDIQEVLWADPTQSSLPESLTARLLRGGSLEVGTVYLAVIDHTDVHGNPWRVSFAVDDDGRPASGYDDEVTEDAMEVLLDIEPDPERALVEFTREQVHALRGRSDECEAGPVSRRFCGGLGLSGGAAPIG